MITSNAEENRVLLGSSKKQEPGGGAGKKDTQCGFGCEEDKEALPN